MKHGRRGQYTKESLFQENEQVFLWSWCLCFSRTSQLYILINGYKSVSKEWVKKKKHKTMGSTVEQYGGDWMFAHLVHLFEITELMTEPQTNSCCVYLLVAVANAENLVYTSIWCKSWVPWPFSHLQKVKSHDVLFELEDTHTPASCLTCLLCNPETVQFKKWSANQISTVRDVFIGICNPNIHYTYRNIF